MKFRRLNGTVGGFLGIRGLVKLFIHFLQGATLSLSAALMPGPFQAFIVAQALKNGWRASLPIALVPLVTDGPIIVLVLLALTRMPPCLVDGLRVAGGLFMIYLARGAFRALPALSAVPDPDPEAARKGFVSAVALNLLNPNPYLFWSVLAGPIVISGWREGPELAVGFVAGFYGTFVMALALLIWGIGTAGRLNLNVTRFLMALTAAALLGFGLYQGVTGIRALLG